MFRNVHRTTKEVLDFSFCSLRDAECIIEAAPQQVVTGNDDVGTEDDQNNKTKVPRKSHSRSLLLNNNYLIELNNIPEALNAILFNPILLAWLDLSFNTIVELPPIFKTMTSLKILYLHGNQIATMDTVHNLKVLSKSLLKLTLHGNPIQDVKGYRMFFINMMPHMKEMDFSFVSESEKKMASFLMRSRRRSANRKKPSD